MAWTDRAAIIFALLTVPLLVGRLIYLVVPLTLRVPGVMRIRIAFIAVCVGVAVYSLGLVVQLARKRESIVVLAMARDIFFLFIALTLAYDLGALIPEAGLTAAFGGSVFGLVEVSIGKIGLLLLLHSRYADARGSKPRFKVKHFLYEVSFHEIGERYAPVVLPPSKFEPARRLAHVQIVMQSLLVGTILTVVLVLLGARGRLWGFLLFGAIFSTLALVFLEARLWALGGPQTVTINHTGMAIIDRRGSRELAWKDVISTESQPDSDAIALKLRDDTVRVHSTGHRSAAFDDMVSLIRAGRENALNAAESGDDPAKPTATASGSDKSSSSEAEASSRAGSD